MNQPRLSVAVAWAAITAGVMFAGAVVAFCLGIARIVPKRSAGILAVAALGIGAVMFAVVALIYHGQWEDFHRWCDTGIQNYRCLSGRAR